MTAQVGTAVNLFKTTGQQQIAHRLGLIVTVLEHQPAARVEMVRRLVNDQAQIVKAIDPATKALAGSKRTSPSTRWGSADAI